MINTTKIVEIKTNKENEMIDVTQLVRAFIYESNITAGIVVLFVPHTTAAITINENADPDVKRDFILGLSKSFPKDSEYRHYEGNSHAHIRSSVVGVDQTILVKNRELQLGTWQGIYFCEFDGPRSRNLNMKAMGE